MVLFDRRIADGAYLAILHIRRAYATNSFPIHQGFSIHG
jgi:hypothetical protein